MAVNAIRRGLWAGTRQLGLELRVGIRALGVEARGRGGMRGSISNSASNGGRVVQGGENGVNQGVKNGGGNVENGNGAGKRAGKLHGRAFYESIGSPRFVLAPMVDQSEFVRLAFPFFSSFASPEQGVG